MAKSPINARVSQSRERRRKAGLKRVEVYAPADKVHLVKAYAAQLREGGASEKIIAARKLIARAYKRFHASCLDNIAIDPDGADLSDAAVVAAALMHRGNAEAYRLGRDILNLVK